MPTPPEHAFKEKSTKLLILPSLRTIYNRTFQCETPCILIANLMAVFRDMQQAVLLVDCRLNFGTWTSSSSFAFFFSKNQPANLLLEFVSDSNHHSEPHLVDIDKKHVTNQGMR